MNNFLKDYDNQVPIMDLSEKYDAKRQRKKMKKAYYKLSYIDDFGNGETEFFCCSEDAIREKAKALFDKEKIHAVKEVDKDQYEKPYFYESVKSEGYIVKEVGFTLAHHIQWEQIFLDSKQKNLTKAYLVKDVGHSMVTMNIGVFSSLKKAKQAVMEKNKKPSEIVKEDDYGSKLPNGKFVKTERGYIHSYFYNQKVSYEYDEWDIASKTFAIDICPILSEVEIERV